MKTLLRTFFLLCFLVSTNLYAKPLTQQQADAIIAEAVQALNAANLSEQSPYQYDDNYDDAHWAKAIAIIIEYPELADDILAALEANDGLKKAISKEIKWREFICSHTRYQSQYSDLMHYQNTMVRLKQHSFREKGQHTIHDTSQTGCNRSIYEGDNPATTHSTPASGS
jgi:lipopolysaccharide export LptBFGC system permease protein LptF